MFWLSLGLTSQFPLAYIHGWNYFQDHSQFSEQLLESGAAIGKP
jgi:hypothetical protein